MSRCLLSMLLLCALLLAIVRLGDAAEVDLEKTTTVSLTVENQPLSTVLTKFAEQTGAPVRVDSFIETQKKKALGRRINIDVKDRPYWEAADAIMDAADLQLERITRRGVALEPRSRSQAGKEKESRPASRSQRASSPSDLGTTIFPMKYGRSFAPNRALPLPAW